MNRRCDQFDNGRSVHLEGSPITIYAPPFARVKENVKNLDTVHLSEQNAINLLETPGLLYVTASKIYDSVSECQDAVYPTLRRLLGVDFLAQESFDDGNNWFEVEGIAYVDVTAFGANEEAHAASLYVELRNSRPCAWRPAAAEYHDVGKRACADGRNVVRLQLGG